MTKLASWQLSGFSAKNMFFNLAISVVRVTFDQANYDKNTEQDLRIDLWKTKSMCLS